MQVLYAMSQDPAVDFKKAQENYRHAISQSFVLYLFTLRYLIQVAKYARDHAAKKKTKLRPTEDDLNFTPRLIENSLMESLIKNEGLLQLFRLHKLDPKIDADTVRLVYNDFAPRLLFDTG